jgi:Lrp/AsnC family leucine-responsive transcriptional regulator
MDRINQEILTLLSRDARLSWQEIGRRVHLTGQAVATRVQQLADDGVILRFGIVRGDLRRYFITVFLDGPRFQDIETFLHHHPDVESASKIAGEGCYHVVLACADDADLEAFTELLQPYGRYRVASELRRIREGL